MELVTSNEPYIKINRESCSLTGDCVKNCPTGAIQFTGEETRVSDILNEIEKDILYYRMSGGGVTLTGGEPFYQPDFSRNILKECKRKNIHTAIETCLFCEKEVVAKISDSVDLFIVDMKIFDNNQHILYTGRSNNIIKENIRSLVESGKPLLVRIPVIPNINDSEENKNACVRFIHEIDEHITVEYISFNPLAENNYKKLDIPFLLYKKKY
jgi:pyruvate formate lyase activating enzyme